MRYPHVIFCLFFSNIAYAVEYTGQNLRDPFTEVNSQSPDSGARPSSLVLGGILWSPKNPHAIVNGGLVSVGTKIGSALVVEISRESVKMKDGDREFLLERKGSKL